MSENTPSPSLITLLEDALKIPGHQSEATRLACAAVTDRNARIASAPAADWQPPDPAEVDLKDYVRLILKGDDTSRATRGYHSSLRGMHFQAADGEIIRLDSLIAGLPVWIKSKFVEDGFGRDNKELTALHKLHLLTVEPATIDGKTHVPLYDATAAFKYSYWCARSYYASFESGRPGPKLITATLVAEMVAHQEPALANVLRNIAGGSRELSPAARSILYPFSATQK